MVALGNVIGEFRAEPPPAAEPLPPVPQCPFISTEALRFQLLPEAVAVVIIGTGKTRTAPGMSSGLMGVLLSVDGGVSPRGKSSDDATGGGDVIMSSNSRALFFTETNSFFLLVVMDDIFVVRNLNH